VLDEPSIGLHPRDTHRLIDILKGLRDLGNTILVVEHDPDTIAAADYVIDLGPGAASTAGICYSPGRVPNSPRAASLSPRGISTASCAFLSHRCGTNRLGDFCESTVPTQTTCKTSI